MTQGYWHSGTVGNLQIRGCCYMLSSSAADYLTRSATCFSEPWWSLRVCGSLPSVPMNHRRALFSFSKYWAVITYFCGTEPSMVRPRLLQNKVTVVLTQAPGSDAQYLTIYVLPQPKGKISSTDWKTSDKCDAHLFFFFPSGLCE